MVKSVPTEFKCFGCSGKFRQFKGSENKTSQVNVA